MRLAVFEHLHGAAEVVLHDLPAARAPVHAREHARIRRRIHDPVGGGQRINITLRAKSRMGDFHTDRLQGPSVRLAARADEIVEAEHLNTRIALDEMPRECAADEPAHS